MNLCSSSEETDSTLAHTHLLPASSPDVGGLCGVQLCWVVGEFGQLVYTSFSVNYPHCPISSPLLCNGDLLYSGAGRIGVLLCVAGRYFLFSGLYTSLLHPLAGDVQPYIA